MKFKRLECIVKCAPYAVTVGSEEQSTRCAYCLEVKSLTRCNKCKEVFYCSTSCRASDAEDHSTECVSLLASGGNPGHETRLVARVYQRYMREMGSHTKEDVLGTSTAFDDIPSLKGDFAKKSKAVAKFMAMDVAQFLRTPNTALLVRIAEKVIANAIYIESQDTITGIYLTMSRIAHSCEVPSTYCYYYDKRDLVIRASQDVEIKDINELRRNYAPDYTSDPIEDRRKALKQIYGFVCMCPRCSTPDEGDVVNTCGKELGAVAHGTLCTSYPGLPNTCHRLTALLGKLGHLPDNEWYKFRTHRLLAISIINMLFLSSISEAEKKKHLEDAVVYADKALALPQTYRSRAQLMSIKAKSFHQLGMTKVGHPKREESLAVALEALRITEVTYGLYYVDTLQEKEAYGQAVSGA